MGLGKNNQVVEVFESEVTGTWTIVVSTAAGMSCVVAAGQAFTLFLEALPAPGDDL
jgi:glucosamine 6-phosphate synthetase-like amidotransferase/phosphosugar isomerase protein